MRANGLMDAKEAGRLGGLAGKGGRKHVDHEVAHLRGQYAVRLRWLAYFKEKEQTTQHAEQKRWLNWFKKNEKQRGVK